MQKQAPTALIWNAKLHADQPLLHQGYLMMPEALNGRILPQDARPLIMSAILQKELVKRRNPPDRYFALLLLIWCVGLFGSIALFVIIGNALSLGPLSDRVGGAIVLTWFLILFGGSILLGLRNNRKQRLEADFK